jgi:hypothetical protein
VFSTIRPLLGLISFHSASAGSRLKRGEIDPLDRVEHEPSQVICR